MLSTRIQRRAAEVQRGWTLDERARRAADAERRCAELIDLIAGSPTYRETEVFAAGPRSRLAQPVAG